MKPMRKRLAALMCVGIFGFAVLPIAFTASAVDAVELIIINPFDFAPVTDGYEFIRFPHMFINMSASEQHWTAPVHLPHRAVIEEVQSVWTDTDDVDVSDPIHIRFYRFKYDKPATTREIAQVDSVAGDGALQKTTRSAASLSYTRVINKVYKYYINLTFPANGGYDKQFHSVRIKYTPR